MSDQSPRPGISRIGWAVAFVLAAALIGLAYVSLKKERPHVLPDRLQRISQVPGFSLTDQTGKSVTLEDLKGKIWVANFIFTRCKGPCPTASNRMQELNTKLKKARENVQLVTFTVDPGYDTPQVLADYGSQLGAEPGHWQFLTGSPDSIEAIVVKGLLQPISKEPDGTPAHSTRFVLVDAEGWLRGFQDGLDPEAVQKLMMDIGDLLRENKPSKK
jgi:protein SCO1/2